MISVTMARIRSRDGAIKMLGPPITRSGEDVIVLGSTISMTVARISSRRLWIRSWGYSVVITDSFSLHTSCRLCASTGSRLAYDGSASRTTPRLTSGSRSEGGCYEHARRQEVQHARPSQGLRGRTGGPLPCWLTRRAHLWRDRRRRRSADRQRDVRVVRPARCPPRRPLQSGGSEGAAPRA